MKIMSDLLIRAFERGDQENARSLILAGLGDHFDTLDPTFNPDLDDIWQNYIVPGNCFVVVLDGDRIIGTGALIKEAADTGRIVRMSVATEKRRQGIGRMLVGELLEEGTRKGYSRIVVETNDDWHGAIQLYQTCGFRPYDHRDGEIHLQLVLGEQGSQQAVDLSRRTVK